MSFHVPYFRNVNQSHCLTIIDFSGTGIESAGVASVGSFVDNVLDRGAPMRNVEPRTVPTSRSRSPWITLYKLLVRLLG